MESQLNNMFVVFPDNRPIEIGTVYSDGIWEYLVVGVDESLKTLAYIIDPFHCELINEKLDEQKIEVMSLSEFQNTIVAFCNEKIEPIEYEKLLRKV